MSSLSEATRLHTACRDVKVHRHLIQDDELRRFCQQVRLLRSNLREDEMDDRWSRAGRLLSRFGWMAAQSLLNFAHPALWPPTSDQELDAAIKLAKYQNPGLFSAFSAIRGMLTELRRRTESPLLRPTRQLLLAKKIGRVLLAHSDGAIREATESLLREEQGLQMVEVLSVDEIDELEPGEAIVTGAPPGWLPERITIAPRATTVHVVTHNWLRESPLRSHVLCGATGRAVVLREEVSVEESLSSGSATAPAEASTLSAAELQSLLSSPPPGAGTTPQHDATDEEKCEATLVVLAGDHGVFLEPDATVRALELEAGKHEAAPDVAVAYSSSAHRLKLSRLPVGELEPGMFLLDRSRSDGLALEAMLEQIVDGSVKRELEANQKLWKEPFAQQLTLKGKELLSRVLASWGCPHAGNPQNLANWASPDTHLPQSRACFDAILKLIKLEQRSEELWNNGRKLQVLGRLAGTSITDVLLQDLVNVVDLTSLRRTGVAEVCLTVSADTSISVLRVQRVLPRRFQVPQKMLRQVFPGLTRLQYVNS